MARDDSARRVGREGAWGQGSQGDDEVLLSDVPGRRGCRGGLLDDARPATPYGARHGLSFAKGTEFQWRDDEYAVPESYHPASQGDRAKSEKWGKDRTRRQKEREEKKRMASVEDEGKWKRKALVKGQGTTGVGQTSGGGAMSIAGKRTRGGGLRDVRTPSGRSPERMPSMKA